MLDRKPHIKFDKRGLVPAIVQHAETQEVIHLVYMDKKALKKTQQTGKLWLFNRSQKKVWLKGQRSGATIDVEEILSHVDKYALLVKGIPNGPNCQTGEDSCFAFSYWKRDSEGEGDADVLDSFRKIFEGEKEEEGSESEEVFVAGGEAEEPEPAVEEVESEEAIEILQYEEAPEIPEKTGSSRQKKSTPVAPPVAKDVLAEWYWHVAEQIEDPKPGSVSAKLESKGIREISRKLGQDVIDLTAAAFDSDSSTTVKESADLLQHWLLLLASQGVTLSEVYEELEHRLL